MKMVKCPQAVPFFGTSRKGSQSPKGGLVSACLISVSVLSFLFCFCLVSFGLSGRGSGERNSEAKKSLSRWLHSPFYRGGVSRLDLYNLGGVTVV